MIYIALGCLLLGALLGIGGLRRAGRLAAAAWRPGAGMLSVAALCGAGVLAVKEAWIPAVLLGLVGGGLALSARSQAGRMRPAKAARSSGMTVEEASAILGVSADASPEEVAEAYRRLMHRAHPDKGGSSGLAAQINAARDVMNRRSGPPAARP